MAPWRGKPEYHPHNHTGTAAPTCRWRKSAASREVAERFKPDKIILFGSHAYGKPHADSDVDILVVMPARSAIDQAVRVDRMTAPPFPLDLIVRTPKTLAWHLAGGDSLSGSTGRLQ